MSTRKYPLGDKKRYPLGDQYYPLVGVEENIGHAQVLRNSHLEIIQQRFVKTCGGKALDQGWVGT